MVHVGRWKIIILLALMMILVMKIMTTEGKERCCGLIDFWARAGELLVEYETAGSGFSSDLFTVDPAQSSASAHGQFSDAAPGQFSAAAPDMVSAFPSQSSAAFISSKIERQHGEQQGKCHKPREKTEVEQFYIYIYKYIIIKLVKAE
ncbi:hypothetical protein ACOSQ3_021768 [Xanthoceras sorbifolium]